MSNARAPRDTAIATCTLRRSGLEGLLRRPVTETEWDRALTAMEEFDDWLTRTSFDETVDYFWERVADQEDLPRSPDVDDRPGYRANLWCTPNPAQDTDPVNAFLDSPTFPTSTHALEWAATQAGRSIAEILHRHSNLQARPGIEWGVQILQFTVTRHDPEDDTESICVRGWAE